DDLRLVLHAVVHRSEEIDDRGAAAGLLEHFAQGRRLERFALLELPLGKRPFTAPALAVNHRHFTSLVRLAPQHAAGGENRLDGFLLRHQSKNESGRLRKRRPYWRSRPTQYVSSKR